MPRPQEQEAVTMIRDAVNELELDEDVTKYAIRIAQGYLSADNDPMGSDVIAACAVYGAGILSGVNNHTPGRVMGATGVAGQTVLSRYSTVLDEWADTDEDAPAFD